MDNRELQNLIIDLCAALDVFAWRDEAVDVIGVMPGGRVVAIYWGKCDSEFIGRLEEQGALIIESDDLKEIEMEIANALE